MYVFLVNRHVIPVRALYAYSLYENIGVVYILTTRWGNEPRKQIGV